MTTNRRGFFGMFAGLLSAIGFKKYTPIEPKLLTQDGLNQVCKDLEDCEIGEFTMTFWYKINDDPWVEKSTKPVGYTYWEE